MVRLPDCPICQKQITATAVQESSFFPFCSERCRNVDLLRWSDGRYAIVEPISPDNLTAEMLDELDENSELDGL
jgi:uncharacterized protein